MSVSLSTLLRHFGEKKNSEETYAQEVSPEKKEESISLNKKINKSIKKKKINKKISINFGKILFKQKYKNIVNCIEYIIFGNSNNKIDKTIQDLSKLIQLNILIINSNKIEKIGDFSKESLPIAVVLFKDGHYFPISNKKSQPFFFSIDLLKKKLKF